MEMPHAGPTRRRVTTTLAALVTLGVVATAAAAPASAATPSSSGWPCGYFEDGSSAWYNHCTDDGSAIQIRVNYVAGPDKNRCVGPKVTRLGFAYQIRDAWYTGKLC
jgi:hypothetical protein